MFVKLWDGRQNSDMVSFANIYSAKDVLIKNFKWNTDMNVYDFTVKNSRSEEVSLKEYRGKVLLIVNTATGCGFTPQYKGLEELYREFKDQGFEVLDFPCNQFGHQAPGSDAEINEFCTLKYDTTFPRFKKIDVNGKDEAPLYKWLKSRKGGLFGSRIKWNFTKFLLDRSGEVVDRFGPTTPPSKIRNRILQLLEPGVYRHRK